MKTLTKNQVIKAAIKIAKNANKSLEKILKDNDMFFEPYDSWEDGAIDHSKDIHDGWENVSIRNFFIYRHVILANSQASIFVIVSI